MLLEVGESRRELHISEEESVAAILEEEIGKTLNLLWQARYGDI